MLSMKHTGAPPDRGRVLIAGGASAWADHLAEALSTEGHRALRVENLPDLPGEARTKSPDAIILAAGADPGAERALLEQVRRAQPDAQMVLVCEAPFLAQAFDWTKAGLGDFVEAAAGPAQCLLLAVRRAVERRWLHARLRQLDIGPLESAGTEGLVSSSNAMREILRRVTDLARTNTSVLLEGEEGSGRGTLARAMHLAGPRREEPFIRVSCVEVLAGDRAASGAGGRGARPVKGAMTLEEVFSSAGRGTIFLEAVEMLKGEAQRELLSRLEVQEQVLIQGAGARSEQPRILASTSHDLDLKVQRGQFDGTLYRRLKADSIRVPPLRERREEIPALVRHFFRQREAEGETVKGIDGATLNLLCRYDWPGNLRELEDCLRYTLEVTGGQSIRTDDLPEKIVDASRQQAVHAGGGALSLKGYEKYTIEQALSLCEGDVVAAATMLGIGRSTLYRKMKSHGVHRRAFRKGRVAGA